MMGNRPYPEHYFFCNKYFFGNNWEKSKDKAATMAKFSREVGKMVGEVAGETGIEGLRIDFNNGLRLQVPTGNWHVTIGDYDSGLVFYDGDISEAILVSMEKYYFHWQIEVFRDGEPVFGHIFDPAGQKIRLVFVSKLIGDMLSFLPYVPMIRDMYQADVYLCIDKSMEDICNRLFPDIRQGMDIEEDTYASYYFATGMEMWGWTPLEGRMIPMTQTGQVILGLPPYSPPKLSWPVGPCLIKEPYVCIGVQASAASKGWHYPHGWDEVTAYLKSLGYRVLCIDRDKKYQAKETEYTMEMPKGAEDFTGDRPLLERADMLHHAEFFVGLSSGLSWLAYTAECPVVMIGGFTMHWHEFPTPYRVYNRLVCNGCYNDLRIDWQENNCARQCNGNEEDILQCSKKITPRMVIQAIDRLIADKKAGRLGQSSFPA